MNATRPPLREVASPVGPGALAPMLAGVDVDAFLADPDRFLDRGVTLKDDPPSRVVRVPLGGRDVVVKRFRHPDPWRALRRALRPSRARRALAASALLAAEGLAVPAPLGWLEARRGPFGTGSWWLTEFVDGREAPEVLAEAAGDGARLDALAADLADVVATLQRARIAHGDLKATNVLMPEVGAPVLIDLHDARRVGSVGPFGDRRLRRDRRRFRRNFDGAGAVGRAVEAALRARGVPAD